MNFATKSMSIVLSFGIAAIALGSPAIASEPSERSANASEISAVQANVAGAPAAAKKRAAAQKHCLTMEPATGSRMTTRECKTKAEWEMLGYEVSDKK